MYKPTENIDIPKEDPFQNDVLKREIYADNLEKIIQHTDNNLVISIDAGWGKGKTTFIKMWKQKLDNSGEYQTLYFNAWENDDSEDPLISLMVDMEEAFPKPEPEKFTKVKEAGKMIIKKAIPTALKIASHGLLDLKPINLGDHLEEELENLAGELGSIELKNYKNEKENKYKFKEALKNYQKSIGKKIMFFIDELDRCRPTYAVETLEKVKHLFDIDGYVFILSLDMTQLTHCVKQVYGQGIDSQGYLRRFIDLEYNLPEPNKELYIDYLINKYKLRTNNSGIYFLPYLKGLVIYNNLSLREINKLIYYLNLIIPMTELLSVKNNVNPLYLQVQSIIYSLFPILKLKDSEAYKEFLRGDLNCSNNITKLIPNDDIFLVKRLSRYESNFNSVLGPILHINSDIKVAKLKYEDDYLFEENQELSAFVLLDSDNKKLKFIDILEFADNFNIPE